VLRRSLAPSQIPIYQVQSVPEANLKYVAQKVMPYFFFAVYIYSKIMKITYSSERVCVQTLFSNKASVHFNNLLPPRNKRVYVVLVPFLVLLLFAPGSKLWTQVSSDVTVLDKRTPPSRTYLGISEIMDDVRGGLLGVSRSNTKPI
jgi:hypothetical protein